jgi:hypothetical protein
MFRSGGYSRPVRCVVSVRGLRIYCKLLIDVGGIRPSRLRIGIARHWSSTTPIIVVAVVTVSIAADSPPLIHPTRSMELETIHLGQVFLPFPMFEVRPKPQFGWISVTIDPIRIIHVAELRMGVPNLTNWLTSRVPEPVCIS